MIVAEHTQCLRECAQWIKMKQFFCFFFPHIISDSTSTLERSHSTLTQFSLSRWYRKTLCNRIFIVLDSRGKHTFFFFSSNSNIYLSAVRLCLSVCAIFPSLRLNFQFTQRHTGSSRQSSIIVCMLNFTFLFYFFFVRRVTVNGTPSVREMLNKWKNYIPYSQDSKGGTMKKGSSSSSQKEKFFFCVFACRSAGST